MANDFLVSLGVSSLAAAIAVLAVLALRRSVRRLFGAGIAYALWLIVPCVMLATLLPARIILVPQLAETAPAVLQHATDVPVDPILAHAVTAAPVELLNGQQILLAVWLAGFAVSLFLLVIGQRRALAQFGRITDDPRDSRIARASIGVAGPALVGVVRPRLVLPHDFEERFDVDEQAMILTHERTHLASGHAAINALVALVKAFHWFNPLIHLGARYARVDQELACDAAVVAHYPHERQIYAQALLKTQLASVSLPLGCAWHAVTPGLLEERLIMLAQDRPGRLRLITGVSAVIILFVAAGLAACAAKPPIVKEEQAPLSAQTGVAPPGPSPATPMASAPIIKPAQSGAQRSLISPRGDVIASATKAEPVGKQDSAPVGPQRDGGRRVGWKPSSAAPAEVLGWDLRIVAVKYGLLDVRSASGETLVHRYLEPGESYFLQSGQEWNLNEGSAVSVDDTSAFEWWTGDQSHGYPLAPPGLSAAQIEFVRQGRAVFIRFLQAAPLIPVQLTSPRSSQPVLRLDGKTSPVLDGSSVVKRGFGYVADPFSGKTAFHAGVDLAASLGAAVHAPADGVVTFAAARDGYGNVVELDLGNSINMRFGHLHDIRVKEGDTVKPGAVVGTVGATGRTIEDELHLEYYWNGKAYDPAIVKDLVF